MKAQLKPRINLEGRTPLQDVIPLATPFIVFIDPATACNFGCQFCPTGHFELDPIRDRYNGLMKFDLFKKVIDDLSAFDEPIKVLRLYKDGEPFLNKKLAAMVAYAKQSGRVRYIDTTTNASLLTPERLQPVLEAGIDKINVSIYGMHSKTYEVFSKAKVDIDKIVENVRWLYANRGSCEVVVKIPDELLAYGTDDKERFFEAFGDHADRIFVENFAPCWPNFDTEQHTGVKITKGIYQQDIADTEVCPYIFYSYSVNSDGLVSSCFLDWGRKLIIGDARTESMKSIWNSDKMNNLRLQHLHGDRRSHPVCGNCGQLSHCLPDNIDQHRERMLARLENYLAAEAVTA